MRMYFQLRLGLDLGKAKIAIILILIGFGVCKITQVSSSRGDRDYIYHDCLKECKTYDCEGDDYMDQKPYLEVLGWNCLEECKYRCMWETVAKFTEKSIDVPQFHGKWPFIRFLGIQEPASVLASILNLMAHLNGIRQFRSQVPQNAPLFLFWHVFALVCINGWVWSTIFHTKDTYFTELMDYFCAFSMVVFSFFSAFVRLFERVTRVEVISIGAIIAAFYAYHVQYLSQGRFDYGYNMKANISIGVLNAAIWLIWSGVNRKTHPHVWKCAVSILLAVASIFLEINDFSPILWILDAHALWHFATAAISPLWYKFIIDDCKFLLKNKEKSS